MCCRGLVCQYEIWEVKHDDVWSRYSSCSDKVLTTTKPEESSCSSSSIKLEESPSCSSCLPPQVIDDDEEYDDSSTNHASTANPVTEEIQLSCNLVMNKEKSESSSEDDNDDMEDPAYYSGKRIDKSVISMLLNKPCQPAEGFQFPVTSGRRCQCSYFYRTLPDGTTRQRKWLSYSKSSDRLYCLHCILFGGPSTESTAWVTNGINNWSSAQRDLCAHETTLMHRTAETNRYWLTLANNETV